MKTSHSDHPKLSITEKRRNKSKYLTRKSIRFKFVKKTSMPNPVKTLGYIKCYSTIRYSIRYNCKKICSWSRRIKTILEIRKKAVFLWVSTNLLFTSFSDFTNNRKKTNGVIVFSSRPFPNILKYRNNQWDLLTFWKIRLLQTHIEEFS